METDNTTTETLEWIRKRAEESRNRPDETDNVCPACLGSGFRPMSPERGALHERCDHIGVQDGLRF